MSTQRKDQPSGVSTQEIPRAPDEHVVTSDLPREVVEGPGESDRAAAAFHQDGADTPAPAAGDDEAQGTRRRHRDRASERKIGRLRAELAQSEARNAEREVRLAALEATIQKIATPPVARPKAPKLVDFPNSEAYADAYAAWKATSTPAAPPAASRTPTPAAPTAAPKAAPTDKEVTAFRKACIEALGADLVGEIQTNTELAIDKETAEYMFGTKFGPQIYAYLSNNVEVSHRLVRLESAQKGKELADLEARARGGELISEVIESEPLYDQDERGAGDREEPETPPARRSRAPEPPSDPRPRGAASAGRRLQDMNMDDFAAQRTKEILRRQGRIIN